MVWVLACKVVLGRSRSAMCLDEDYSCLLDRPNRFLVWSVGAVFVAS